jgi:hypothetical protein
MAEIFDPDIVVDLSRNVFNPDVYRGYERVRRWVEVVDEMWDEFEAKIEFGVFTVRNGRLVRYIGGYRDRREALEAAGLSE